MKSCTHTEETSMHSPDLHVKLSSAQGAAVVSAMTDRDRVKWGKLIMVIMKRVKR